MCFSKSGISFENGFIRETSVYLLRNKGLNYESLKREFHFLQSGRCVNIRIVLARVPYDLG